MAKSKRRTRSDEKHATFVQYPAGKEHASGETEKKRARELPVQEETPSPSDDGLGKLPHPASGGTGGAGWAY